MGVGGAEGVAGAESGVVSNKALRVALAACRFSFKRKLSPRMLMMVQQWSGDQVPLKP